ncbi:hypothetical protein AB0K12_11320 [Nonomuraea sp. NPDC049419]|uniref:hypothetical protein n=1 Tax=Nonomuraea sp. NPDC049419 TaxID=3155772 RepID=UPI003426BFC8
MSTSVLRVTLALIMTVAGLALVGSPAAQAADTQPLNVRILLVNCAAPCDEQGLEAAGESTPDFYGKITFAGFPTHTTPRAPDDQSQVAPFWTHSQQIPTTVVEQEISIQIWDHDSTSGDDLADTSPVAGQADTRFKVNMIHGTVSGDLNDSTGCVAGNGEPGGGIFGPDPKPSVQVCLEVTPHAVADSDGDGFTDYAEHRGLDFDDDNVVDLTLPGVDPERRDVYVEIDWMKDRKPQDGVLERVEEVFDRAPVTNEQTGATGLALHLVADEEVPYAEAIDFSDDRRPGAYDDFDDIKSGSCGPDGDGHFGTKADRASPLCEEIVQFKRRHFRYGVFINGLTGSGTTSGRAELHDRGGDDFVVSLGRWTDDMLRAGGGRVAVEQGTLLHELGHTFGLGHGGRYTNGVVDSINCKPNYQSVMNYAWQTQNLDSGRPLDYQRFGKQTLLENDLDETQEPGLAGAREPVIHGKGGVVARSDPDEKIDWDGDGTFTTDAVADINHIPDFEEGCTSDDASERLVSNPDWSQLVYGFTGSPYWADGNHGPIVPELTGDAVLKVTAVDLTAGMTVDKAEAAGGDTVTATVTIGNKGASTSSETSVTFTPPVGDPVTRPLDDLAPERTATETFTYEIPCTAADGSALTSTAEVTGENADGLPEPESTLADNKATAVTTVSAPVMAVTATATASVHAGEAITYTIGHRNTGHAPATGAELTYVLPADVYYSQALDAGAGPRPGEVTRSDDGTTTLTWPLGTVAPGASGEVTFTARPGLLFEAGATVTGRASLAYGGANDCTFGPAAATAQTAITEAAPGRHPLLSTLWALRTDLRTDEVRARVQATDTRFDGNGDGALSQKETSDALLLPLLQPKELKAELLATTLNLATRQINAGTHVHTPTITKLKLETVGDAVRHARQVLAEPPTVGNLVAYTDATLVLVQINSGVAERY